MSRFLFAFSIIFIISFSSFAQSTTVSNLQAKNVYSSVLKENRTLNILLPDEYSGTYFRYPVIYLMDAEKNFQNSVEVLSFMMENHFIPPHIIVGVQNADRFRDMTPVDSVLNKTIFPTRGGANNFLKALEMDIFPFINKEYRANSRRMVIGHNYSGLFVVHSFIARNDLFDRYLAFSPILWWNNTSILGDTEKFIENGAFARKHLFVSFAKEAKNMLEACKSYIKIMEKAPDNIKWKYAWMPDEDHYSLYRKSLMQGMEAIFKDYKYPTETELAEGGLNLANTFQRNILLQYGRNEKLPYSLLESTSLLLKNRKDYDNALVFLDYTAKNYPERAESFFHAGEIYESTNKHMDALKCYQIAHEKDKGRWDYEQKYLAMQKHISELKNNTKPKVDL
jgi:predicted alpha/beta superfamily hydrolase